MGYFFYNLEGIGNVLLVKNCFDKEVTSTKDFDGVTALYNNDEVIGYNVFDLEGLDMSSYQGRIMPVPEVLLEKVNELLNKHNLPNVDASISGGFKVGKVLECVDHPDSDHLHVLKVDVGNEVLQIVCGAANVAQDKLVVVALNNTMMMDGSVIRPGSLRGVASNGMCCSKRELGLTKDPARVGIILLDETYKVGEDFDFKG
jgi:tRNA-binding protein